MKIFKVTQNPFSKISEGIYNNANRILNVMEKETPEGFYSGIKEIKPFYNKFLPKALRRTKSIEFYPDSHIKKLEMTFNNDNVLLRAEQFDSLGKSTYFETFNPITKKGFVRKREDGLKVEQTFIGSVLRKMKKYDQAGNMVYSEKYNPKTKIKEVLTVKPIMMRKEVYRGDELIHSYERYIDGNIYEEGFFPETGLRYSQMGERIRKKNGKFSNRTKLTNLEVKNSDGTRFTIEIQNQAGTTYYQKRVFDIYGEEVTEKSRNLNSEQVQSVIKALQSGKLENIK